MPEQNQRPERFRLTYKMGAEPRPTDAEVTQDGYVIVSALETISAQIEYLTDVILHRARIDESPEIDELSRER